MSLPVGTQITPGHAAREQVGREPSGRFSMMVSPMFSAGVSASPGAPVPQAAAISPITSSSPAAPAGLNAFIGLGADTLSADEVYSSEQIGAITANSVDVGWLADLEGVEQTLSAPAPGCRDVFLAMFRSIFVRKDRQRRFEARLERWAELAAAVAREAPRAGARGECYDESSLAAIKTISEKPLLATEPLFRVGFPGPDGAVVRSTDVPRQFSYFIRFPQGAPQRHLLCLDLDETLVSSKNRTRQNAETEDFSVTVTVNGRINRFSVTKRPYLARFLNTLGTLYDLCIYTYSIKQYADEVINIIDEQRVIRYRLYRQHCVRVNVEGGKYIIVKDLTRLGRPLSNVLLVDNTKSAGLWQRNNFLYVDSFHGNRSDDHLLSLMKSLIGLAMCRDVYKEISKMREKSGSGGSGARRGEGARAGEDMG